MSEDTVRPLTDEHEGEGAERAHSHLGGALLQAHAGMEAHLAAMLGDQVLPMAVPMSEDDVRRVADVHGGSEAERGRSLLGGALLHANPASMEDPPASMLEVQVLAMAGPAAAMGAADLHSPAAQQVGPVPPMGPAIPAHMQVPFQTPYGIAEFSEI